MPAQHLKLTRALHRIGAVAVLALAASVALLVWYVITRLPPGASASRIALVAAAAFLAVGILVEIAVVAWLGRQLLTPLVGAEAVAARVALGDLSLPEQGETGVYGGQLVTSVTTMVHALRTLTSAMQGAAADASAMAQQIAASTQQMTASTQEVAGTTGELT